MAASVRIASPFSRAYALGEIEAFRSRFLTLVLWLRDLRGFLACCLRCSSMALGIEAVDRLLHERPTLSNAAIDLFRQNLETLVTKEDRLLLPLLRNRRRHRQLVSSVQRDCLGYRTHVMFEAIELCVQIVKTLAQQSLDRGCGLKKMLKGGFHEHALAEARSVGCDVKPTTDTFAKPNCHFAACRGFAPARRSDFSATNFRVQIGQLLHFLTTPKIPMIETAAPRHD